MSYQYGKLNTLNWKRMPKYRLIFDIIYLKIIIFNHELCFFLLIQLGFTPFFILFGSFQTLHKFIN